MKRNILISAMSLFVFAYAQEIFAATCDDIKYANNWEKACPYYEQAEYMSEHNDCDGAIKSYEETMDIIGQRWFYPVAKIGICFSRRNDSEQAIKYFEEASELSVNTTQTELAKGLISLEKATILKRNAPSNDAHSGLQYYIKQLSIHDAWKKVASPRTVIVAVIDDGVDVNHPDLTNNIWVSPTAKYGSSKIIDFVGDGMPANLPVGEHGTMVAGIIGATTDNNEGIAGIAKAVKFMPIRVFDSKGSASDSSVISAMNYAIDNGANIINLSLGGSQFSYSERFDAVIKKAFEKGVVVVIAAGNGDILSSQSTGVNLDTNPIAPICNNGNKYKYSIGVIAGTAEGYRTNWTNYGSCAPFMAPGEDIVSASIPAYNSNFGSHYNVQSGTSFSAPIISGIVALGYNKYGYVDPVTVFDSLWESRTKNEVGNYVVNANSYLDILGGKIAKKVAMETSASMKTQEDAKVKAMKTKVDRYYASVVKKYSKLNRASKIKKLEKLKTTLNQYKGVITDVNKVAILNYLLELVEKDLAK